MAGALLPASPAQAATPRLNARFFGGADSQPIGDGPTGWPRGPVGAIRLWDTGVAWNQIELHKGVFDFTRLDAILATAQSHHARPLLVLGQTPRFYASHPGISGVYGAGAPTMPDLAAWRRYVARVAQRYGAAMDYQVWNEPSVGSYWRGTPHQMAVLTRTARTVLKRWAPTSKVVGPSFPVRLSTQRAWMSRYYGQHTGGHLVGTYFDIVSLNLYPLAAGQPEDSMRLLRTARGILSSHGVHKPIWNTEINYGLTGTGAPAANIKSRKEAAYVSRTYVLNAANKVRRVFWYRWDAHRIGNTQMTYSNDSSLAPGGVAFGVVARWLVGGKVLGCSVSAGTYRCTVSYSTGLRRIYWNPSRSTSVRAVASATRLEGVLGKATALHGGERVSVDYAPVMIRSAR